MGKTSRVYQEVIGVVGAAVLACSALTSSAAPLRSSSPNHRVQPFHAVLAASTVSPPDIFEDDSKTPCLYPDNSLSLLDAFSAETGKTFNCVMAYINGTQTWSQWSTPWVLHPPSADADLLGWKLAVPGRRLILSQSMVPSDAPADWRVLGAAGAYDGYAVQLAENLVAAGLGDSVIRLGWEANGNFSSESGLGTDPAQYQDWALYWGNIVRSMRSVPGADFLFDWTVNAYYQPIPLSEWYPGNSVVNVIGIDAYDGSVGGVESQEARWESFENQPDGLAAVASFAKENGKPLSIPEWGLVPQQPSGAGGDDTAYLEGLAQFIDDNDVVYESYFYHPGADGLLYLPQAPESMAIYKSEFSSGIDLSSAPVSSATPPAPVQPAASTTTTELRSGGKLVGGQKLVNDVSGERLTMQADGNLVLYKGRHALWSTGTWGHPHAFAVLQPSDGNLVVYTASGKALWASHTAGNPHDRLTLQRDGNLVVYSRSGKALWCTARARGPRAVGATPQGLAPAKGRLV